MLFLTKTLHLNCVLVFLTSQRLLIQFGTTRLIIRSKLFTGNTLRLLESFLSNRYQRVTINGQNLDWLPILAGAPQGSILFDLYQRSS